MPRTDDRPALWTLRAALCAMTLGVALHCWREPDALAGWLFVDTEWAEQDLADSVSLTFGSLYALAGLALLTPLARVASVWVGGWAIAQVALDVARDPGWAVVVPFSQAVRWVGPLALGVWLGRDRGAGPGGCVEWALRCAAAATFVGHGLKALGWRSAIGQLGAPDAEFLDFAHVFEQAVLGAAWTQDANVVLLRCVGGLDLLVALLVLLRRWPAVVVWMAVWGVFTASLRILVYDDTGFALFLTRLPNGGVPAALACLWLGAARRSPEDRG